MGSERRIFLKRLAGGSAGIIVSGTSLAKTLINFSDGKKKYDHIKSSSNPVFPFFKYMGRYNIGDFIPKDQGGMFIQMSIMKTEDDTQIVQKVRNGVLEEVYGNPIGWNKFETTEIEKSVWLNRFYFLPSFARMFYLSGDISYLNDMMQIITRWIDENPLLPDSHFKTYNWRDMQVAWRSIHWSWCYFLTEKNLTANQKTLILNSLREHAAILLSGFGKQELNEFNHQAHGALAMLYLGVLFPSLEDAGELKNTALRILTHHLEKAFYNDGGNVEQMFGYYPFETHIFRDTYLLCSQNNLDIPSRLIPTLEKMSRFLSVVAQPDGSIPPVNDSYEMSVIPSIAILNDILNSQITLRSIPSEYLPDSQIGIMRNNMPNNSWYILAYPAKSIGAHAHAGRLAFSAWHNDQPLVIDSGCCNYDNPDLVKWYRTSRAHNTVIIDGKSDELTSSDRLWAPKRLTENRISDWIDNNSFTFCRMVSPPGEVVNSSVSWSRSLALVKNQFMVLHDCFVSRDEHTYEILFHFPQLKVFAENKKKEIIISKNDPVTIIPANAKMIEKLTIINELISIKGESVAAPMAVYQFRGKGTTHSIMVFMVQNDESNLVEIKQESTSHGTGIVITRKKAGKTILLMRNPESPELSLFGRTTTKLFDVF